MYGTNLRTLRNVILGACTVTTPVAEDSWGKARQRARFSGKEKKGRWGGGERWWGTWRAWKTRGREPDKDTDYASSPAARYPVIIWSLAGVARQTSPDVQRERSGLDGDLIVSACVCARARVSIRVPRMLVGWKHLAPCSAKSPFWHPN